MSKTAEAMARYRSGKESASGAGSAETANEKEGSLQGLKRDMQSTPQPQYRIVIDPETIRKQGFESTQQLEEYKNDQYFTSATAQTRKNGIVIEGAPFLDRKGNASIVSGKQDAANFVDYLKTKLDVGVESYTNDSWIVHYKNKSDLSRKRQTKR